METLLAAKCSSEKILPKQKKERSSNSLSWEMIYQIQELHCPNHHQRASTPQSKINDQQSTWPSSHPHPPRNILWDALWPCHRRNGREMSGVTIFRGHVDFAGARWYESQQENLCLTSLQRVETSHPWKCLYQNPPKPLWVLSKTSASCKQINPSQFANPSQPYPSRPIWLPWHPERGLERRTPQRRADSANPLFSCVSSSCKPLACSLSFQIKPPNLWNPLCEHPSPGNLLSGRPLHKIDLNRRHETSK